MIPSTVDVAAALAAAYAAKHGAPAPESAVTLPLAQVLGAEGSLSTYFEGTNNLGAMHATQSFAQNHAQTPGYGMVAFLEHSPGGAAYIARMAVYPSLLVGARALLDLVENFVSLATVANASDYAAQLYAHNYFEGLSAPATPAAERPAAYASNAWTDADRQNIASYAAAISKSLPSATAGYNALGSYTGNPSAAAVGPFAPLAARLTPAASYAPHTLEHAQALLGAAAGNPPPGAISIEDCQAAPGGDGVWLFPLSASSLAQADVAMVARAGPIMAEIALSVVLGLGAFWGAKWLVDSGTLTFEGGRR